MTKTRSGGMKKVAAATLVILAMFTLFATFGASTAEAAWCPEWVHRHFPEVAQYLCRHF